MNAYGLYFGLFWKEIQIFGLLSCSTLKDLSIDVSITTVGLILTKPGWFLYSGYGQVDRQTRFWNPHMETCRHTKNINSKLGVSCRSLYASPDICTQPTMPALRGGWTRPPSRPNGVTTTGGRTPRPHLTPFPPFHRTFSLQLHHVLP